MLYSCRPVHWHESLKSQQKLWMHHGHGFGQHMLEVVEYGLRVCTYIIRDQPVMCCLVVTRTVITVPCVSGTPMVALLLVMFCGRCLAYVSITGCLAGSLQSFSLVLDVQA